MGLKKYSQKRNFKVTPEPAGALSRKKKRVAKSPKLAFVVQKHHASHLHYDFRLEFSGTLKSWAVPKGPSLNPGDKRLAVEVEDHPLEYAAFEGKIPKGEYGAGQVIVWDNGYWSPQVNVAAGLKKGHLDFELHGTKLNGNWSLVRMGKPGPKNNWLLIKKKDAFSKTNYDITLEQPESVLRKKKSPPDFIPPQLAQLVDEVPQGNEWLHELKFDGYRTLCRINQKDIRFMTRSGLDWTAKYQPLVESAAKLHLQNAVLDGELVWLEENGHSNFQLLQNALSEGRFDRMYFYLFDLLFLDGKDLRNKPLRERKHLLEQLLKPLKKSRFLYSEHFNYSPNMYPEICRLQLEGVVSKRADAPYLSGRSPVWQKSKCSLRQEFVIGGYTSSTSNRPFSSLLVGFFDEAKKLRYAGRVGTGFTDASLDKISAKIEKLHQTHSPFAVNSPSRNDIQWLKPELVAEVEFKTWTAEKILRHASFQGLREDKNMKEISFEKKAAVKLTHPERIIYPKTKTTKKEVSEYYAKMAPLLLPYVDDRPVSILRCQKTTSSGCYFQKHTHSTSLVGIRSEQVHYKEKKDSALVVATAYDLQQLAQAGTIEVHSWQGRFSSITKADQIVFDLDPDTTKHWPLMVETAFEIRRLLKTLGLVSFVKVTGGKGLHVHVPLMPLYNWDTVKAFSKSLMQVLSDRNPGQYTTNMKKSNRTGKIFLDYLRNGYGATAIVPYSLRARTEPTVALPISWRELKTCSGPDNYLLHDVLKIVSKRKDPWAGYFRLSQRISVLDRKPVGSKENLELF